MFKVVCWCWGCGAGDQCREVGGAGVLSDGGVFGGRFEGGEAVG